MTGEDRMLRALYLIVVGIVVLAIVAMLLAAKALAHDHNHPERNDWLKSLHGANKTWCCNGDDTDDIESLGNQGQQLPREVSRRVV